ncbi:uncharacterized protein jv isoform X2 [Fopius arisanus]|uniref:Uncharacterized protein jv isoform X2 n=2 Tax=Fopius arisanus TaxID=64838 RepID=A0A9R1TP01_9HYME|nr:PREDICTED: uncharacterized protein LOC105272186 isoform X2 [Fopius arisanus]
MGGAQSGAHNLGDALWMHERQRQRGQREVARYESQSEHNTQDRRKLLKRTRSLAVISEGRNDREVNHNFSLGDPTFDGPRRPQLIPRAKLIDRNSLKDRLSKSQQHLSDTYDRYHEVPYHSQSICDLHSRPSTLPYLELPTRITSREDSDRLNILDWPRTPRRYRSHQDLDTVSGLVDIVEDDWPLTEGQRDIYTQVKRKRKEHRSLDSILFEDDGELEYFDVLNLLPLSKVRLEFDEEDRRNCTPSESINLPNEKGNETFSDADGESTVDSDRRQTPRVLQVSEFSDDNQDSSLQLDSNVTDEEKSKTVDDKIIGKSPTDESWKSFLSSSGRSVWDTDSHRESFDTAKDEQSVRHEGKNRYCNNSFGEQPTDTLNSRENQSDGGENILTSGIVDENEGGEGTRVEEAEDFKSIWISDSEEIDSHEKDMSRRPQVLKIVDSEVTRKRGWGPTVIEIDDVREETNDKKMNSCLEQNITDDNVGQMNPIDKQECKTGETRPSVELARNFFESKLPGRELPRPEGRFEKIVKETSTMIGKACSAVRGSLGFEARSESSDLGLGSDCGSEGRRRSIDDGVDVDDLVSRKKPGKLSVEFEDKYSKSGNKSRTNLTRSRSCLNSLECQEADAPEFDHVRYKIVKSRLFGKNIYGNVPSKGDVGYDGLMQYLREYSFQELLLDNNVVIIEPVRAEIKSSTVGKGKTSVACKAAGSPHKKLDSETNNSEMPKNDESKNIPKQSSLRKHFFYHPIRVNRELIDEELPDPDTVRNVRRMFEATLRPKSADGMARGNCKDRKSVSMKDLSNIDDVRNLETSRSRSSSRAKDLMRLFEGLERGTSGNRTGKGDIGNGRHESKTRIIAQSFEARSGDTSPSDSGCARNKAKRYRQQINRRHHLTNWDAGSVSSGVSSDYPDTDPGSGAHCTSSEDEDIDCREDDAMRNTEREDGHYVSPDVLKKIRECGTSVTYYGGKVVNSCNGPLISPTSCKLVKSTKPSLRLDDYVKFRLVKSNSCDSRLELAGRVVERRSRLEAKQRENNNSSGKSIRHSDLRRCTIAESPSIEITSPDSLRFEDDRVEIISQSISKREPPVVIGLEPKRDESRDSCFKADFRLGKIDGGKTGIANKFTSALTKWQINENDWKRNQTDFGKMEFEEFEVLEDSLNGTDN